MNRRFHNDDIICFLSYLRVWIGHKGWAAESLLEAWSEFKSNHTMDQNPEIQDTTRLLTEQLIKRNGERT